MTDSELIQEGFDALNSFKRSRTLADRHRIEGEREDAHFHELKQYKEFDRIELVLRALKSNARHEERRRQHRAQEDDSKTNVRTVK